MWFSALSNRETLRALHSYAISDDKEGFWKNCSYATSPEEFWNIYLYATSIKTITNSDSETHACAFEEISLNSLKTNHSAIAEWEMEASGKSLLLVDLDCSDIQILDYFKHWLTEKRKLRPLPLSRRGQPTLNVELLPEHIASWERYKILQVYDLDFWATIMQQPAYSHEKLSHIVAPDYTRDSKEWGREARKKMKEAFASVALLVEKVGQI